MRRRDSRVHSRRERGQSLVEYALTLAIAMGIAVIVKNMTASGIQNIWFRLAAEVAAPCSGCSVPESIPVNE